MNSQKLLIVAVVLALLIIGGAVMFVKSNNSGTSAGGQTAHGDQVTVDNAMTACTPKDRCIIVDTKCSFCCNYVAINSKSEVLYNQMFDQTCKQYSGAYCECSDLSSYPSCVNGTCQMVKWSENKALKAPPATTAAPPVTTAPVPAPAPADVTTAPAPAAPTPDVPAYVPPSEPVADAFGESELPEEQSAPPADDLYAPIPDTYKPPADEADVHVIQP